MNDQAFDPGNDRAAVAFHPPVLLLGFIVAGFIVRWLVPLDFLPPDLAIVFGIIVTVEAFSIFAWAVITMRAAGTSVPTHTPTTAIVSRGPYRFSRNPIYLAMVTLLVGIGLWANSLWFLILATLAHLLLTRHVIVPEERYLEAKFGDSYLSYKRRVRRWI